MERRLERGKVALSLAKGKDHAAQRSSGHVIGKFQPRNLGRVDQAYAGLLASAPGGSGASASASVSVGT